MTDEERDQIIDALSERGVTYLGGGQGVANGMSDAELIRALVESEDARLRLAIVALFLACPSISASVEGLVQEVSPETALDLKQRYTAAVCLQGFWRTRLADTIGQTDLLPDLFSAELQLPSLDVQHGKYALAVLAEQMSLAHGSDFLASFNKTFEHFMRQREVENSQREPAATR